MPVEVRPLGVDCNLRCVYCYQTSQRNVGGGAHHYSIPAMKSAIEKEKGSFILFGGEALLIPENDLAELWRWGFEKFGRNGIQTNGILINENHIQMFKKYNVTVGISMDGPGELNDIRWAGSLESTRLATQKSEQAIRRLCEAQVYPGLITTLHRGNASAERLPLLMSWFQEMTTIGIRSIRLHTLEINHPVVREKYALTMDENISVLLKLAKFEKEIRKPCFDIFKEIRNLLLGHDGRMTCSWKGCDPYTTEAVHGVEGNGQRSNCGRVNKDGIDFVKANSRGYERYLALHSTSQDNGGCSGCRYFIMCKGQCPGTAIDGDWRNRSEHCSIWMALFEYFENHLKNMKPEEVISDNDRLALERKLVEAWTLGRNPSLESLLKRNIRHSHQSSSK